MANLGPAHKQDFPNACSTGAIAVLKGLLRSHGIEQGTAPILPRDATDSGGPSTQAMITAATKNSQTALVSFLLSYFTGYPTQWSEA